MLLFSPERHRLLLKSPPLQTSAISGSCSMPCGHARLGNVTDEEKEDGIPVVHGEGGKRNFNELHFHFPLSLFAQ